ncbi:unnamed protein product [Thelazia callipaeda]|uniref:LAGLIDADG_2 domain-containing protein n=1 Tax=Thelazia callipaeda TaxID=103827 RepID=A0A0N5CS14_THECL|nr:unnamed protein product [Thelazia callipaeda]
MGGRYWEVMPDGKTARSPLVYHRIMMELVSVIGGGCQTDFLTPNKITFEFNMNSQVMRKISRSCEFISFL